MRKIVLLLITAIALIGCNKKDANQIRIVLDWTPNTNHTGLYVALEKGWFDEEGLIVSIIQPPEDGALVLVGSGKAEFGIDFQETLGPAIAKERDALPVTAVAAIISHNTSGIMSLSHSNITRPRDLEGKRFASWETYLVPSIIKEIVTQDGGDFSKVIMIPNYPTDALSAMHTDIDAIWIYYAWDGIAAKVNDIDFNYIDLGEADSRFDYYTPVIAANNNWLEHNPETARKFLSAASRGYYYAIEYPVEAAEILLAHAPELERELVIESQKYLTSRYQADAKRWGEIDAERWSRFYKWMYEENLLERDIGKNGFSNEYLP